MPAFPLAPRGQILRGTLACSGEEESDLFRNEGAKVAPPSA
jgi:hypothetical protein